MNYYYEIVVKRTDNLSILKQLRRHIAFLQNKLISDYDISPKHLHNLINLTSNLLNEITQAIRDKTLLKMAVDDVLEMINTTGRTNVNGKHLCRVIITEEEDVD